MSQRSRVNVIGQRGSISPIIVVLLAGILVALIALIIAPRRSTSKGEGSLGVYTGSGTRSGSSDETITSDELGSAGWSGDAVRAVVALNREWFAIQREENPAGFALQLGLLKGLGKQPHLMPFLAVHPETTGLLATLDDPGPIVESLGGPDEDYELLAGCYVQQPAPADARALAIGLRENHELVCALKRHGLIGAEVLFVFDRDNDAAREYEAWLRDALRSRLEGSDEELASFANFVMRQGPELRRRLCSNPDFLKRFRQEFWPALARTAGSDRGMFELYVDDPRVWDILALPNGELLLRTTGMISIDLLYGYPEIGHSHYPEGLHPRICEVLLNGEEHTIDALFRYRDEPLFRHLLYRPLTAEARRAALRQLFLAGTNYPSVLAKYNRLSDSALSEEVGPPPSGLIIWVPFYYTVYEVPKKLIQGRDPSKMEWFQAVCDPAFLVIDIASGGGGKVIRETVTKGGREVAEKVVEKGSEKFVVTTLRNTGLELTKKQFKEIAEKLSERELANWTVTGTLSEMQRAVRNAFGRATTFEVTKPVQFLFRYSGVGRTSWKRWSGMEARLFMRGDSKVYIRMSNRAGAVVGSPTAAFFERTGKDLAVGTLAESEPGQELVQAGARGVLSAKEQLDEWRKQISAWWLLNAAEVPAEPALETGVGP